MRGADSLIALRLRGLKPSLGVMVAVAHGDWDDGTREQPEHEVGAHRIWVRPDEPTPDLRCLHGLPVVVFGDIDVEEVDIRRVAEACEQAGAARLAAYTTNAHGRFDRLVYGEMTQWRD